MRNVGPEEIGLANAAWLQQRNTGVTPASAINHSLARHAAL